MFVKPGSGWATATETAKLIPLTGRRMRALAFPSPSVGTRWWWEHASSDSGRGSAYVFVKPGSGWANAIETAKLTASDGAFE